MPNRLYLGTRRYSSWSMRGWLAVRLAGLAVEDVVVPLEGGQTQALIGLTPTGLVPALEHDGRMIWDSLAICEYCAEAAPLLWPSDKGMRATARSVAARNAFWVSRFADRHADEFGPFGARSPGARSSVAGHRAH